MLNFMEEVCFFFVNYRKQGIFIQMKIIQNLRSIIDTLNILLNFFSMPVNMDHMITLLTLQYFQIHFNPKNLTLLRFNGRDISKKIKL